MYVYIMQVDDKESSTNQHGVACSNGSRVYLSMYSMYICMLCMMRATMYVCMYVWSGVCASRPMGSRHAMEEDPYADFLNRSRMGCPECII
jgi:hypothetical protein